MVWPLQHEGSLFLLPSLVFITMFLLYTPCVYIVPYNDKKEEHWDILLQIVCIAIMKIEQISQTSWILMFDQFCKYLLKTWIYELAHCNCKILSYLVQCADFVGFAIEIVV